jgi:hypothetical protein
MTGRGKLSKRGEMAAKPRIIVDIDNTLWDFGTVLFERISLVNPLIVPPSEWHTWDFWKPFIPARELYAIIREIHMEQDRFTPYPESTAFLRSLRDAGFFIIIASHREKGTMGPTERWLNVNFLVFDEIHLSHDKTVLFDNCWAVVDDSPITLARAAGLGIIRAGLRNPWNEKEEHPLFDTLREVFEYLENTCRSASFRRR